MSDFVAKFISALQPEVKEMMAYTKEDIEKYMQAMQKKVDIF